MEDERHTQSTGLLRALLQHGLSLLKPHERRRSHCRMGPLSCTISSNSDALHEALTRCLLPGGSGGDLHIGILSGNEPPFVVPPGWNLPHTDARHLERLHIAADGSLTAMYNPDYGQWLILDHQCREGLLWIGEEALLPAWEQGSPFKTLLNWFIAPSACFMVHAGAIGTEAGGCLLVGQGGSGKSTTVAACFAAGMRVCGDDLILLDERAEGYRAYGLYDSLKLDPASSIKVPASLAAAPFTPCAGKRLVRYSDVRANGLSRDMPIRAVMRSVIANRAQSVIVPESPAAMLKALVPPTVFLLRGREEAAIPKLGRLVRAAPCFRLELSSDPQEAAAHLAGWLYGSWRETS
jgi:hypothetical protein